ncbi:MAG: hypothetical protein U0271_15245 [Polyangiaceae bacterium]
MWRSLPIAFLAVVACASETPSAQSDTRDSAAASGAVSAPSNASASPSASTSMSASASGSASASASASAEPAPYPTAEIRRAEDASGYDCQKLVYKRGCSETRTGRITVSVALNADGTINRVAVKSNSISRDPKLVEQCVLDSVKKWKLAPPGANQSSFDWDFVFGDKC